MGALTSPMLLTLNLGTIMLRHACEEIDKEQREVAYPKRVFGNIFQPALRVEEEDVCVSVCMFERKRERERGFLK